MLIEDLSLFFNTSDFAVAAIFKGTITVKGIMGNAYVEVNRVESTRPTFTCMLSEVAGVKQGDSLVVSDINYQVVGVKPDGTGVVTLVLELP